MMADHCKNVVKALEKRHVKMECHFEFRTAKYSIFVEFRSQSIQKGMWFVKEWCRRQVDNSMPMKQ